MKRFLFFIGLIIFSFSSLCAQYDGSFDMEGFLKGRWHNYKYSVMWSNYELYPDSIKREFVFYRDTLSNTHPDSVNLCFYLNDSILDSDIVELIYKDTTLFGFSSWTWASVLLINIIDSNEFVVSQDGSYDGEYEFFKRIDNYNRSKCELEIDTVSGIKESIPLDFGLSPNPFEDRFTISLEEKHSGKIQVFDLSGRVLFVQNFTDSKEIIVSSLKLMKGLYTLNLEFQDGSSASKMMVEI